MNVRQLIENLSGLRDLNAEVIVDARNLSLPVRCVKTGTFIVVGPGGPSTSRWVKIQGTDVWGLNQGMEGVEETMAKKPSKSQVGHDEVKLAKRELKIFGYHTHRFEQNPEERRFAEAWDRQQEHGRTLNYLLSESHDNRPVDVSPHDDKTAATLIQWLGSPVGQNFLRELGYKCGEDE